MKRILQGLAAVGVAAGISLLGPGAASAAGPAGQTTTTSSTVVGVPCASPLAWLRLWGSFGERCFRGNGVAPVNVPAVRREQIVGRHRVCLYAIGRPVTCRTGPAIVTIQPRAWIREISIRPPVG